MKFKIDNLQYCNWSRKIFEINREAGLDAVHVTIVYHEDKLPWRWLNSMINSLFETCHKQDWYIFDLSILGSYQGLGLDPNSHRCSFTIYNSSNGW